MVIGVTQYNTVSHAVLLRVIWQNKGTCTTQQLQARYLSKHSLACMHKGTCVQVLNAIMTAFFIQLNNRLQTIAVAQWQGLHSHYSPSKLPKMNKSGPPSSACITLKTREYMKKAEYGADTPWVKHENIHTIAHTVYEYLFCLKGSKAYLGMTHINFRRVFTRGLEGPKKLALSKMFYLFKEKEKKI